MTNDQDKPGLPVSGTPDAAPINLDKTQSNADVHTPAVNMPRINTQPPGDPPAWKSVQPSTPAAGHQNPHMDQGVAQGEVAQKKLVAGLLAIFLGSLGVHKFFLGMNGPGIVLLAVHLGVWFLALVLGAITFGLALFVTLPLAGLVSTALGILGLIEGVVYLSKSDADFEREYIVGKKAWF